MVEAAASAGVSARSADDRTVIEARGLRRTYVGVSGTDLHILRGLDLSVRRGEAVAIIGASGSGKSTLLHLLGALDRPTGGTVRVGGTDLDSLDDEAAASLRNARIGFVFQFHHLLSDFTAIENTMLPALIRGDAPKSCRARAGDLLDQVGLGDRREHKPHELSGGEQQRVAVARALVNRPLAILADEPTGNLDAGLSEDVHDLLFEVKERHGVALVVVTHNHELAFRAERVLRLVGGTLEDV
ncbi:MAG: ABC transporter ATP-binding protein [Gemmatimonadetes bacterium]|nr:ABC transporter ATP-binding protein [Gemmatimonadota bacterium]MYI07203.1 ABC transporter ATP-binding protein [Gemmatimonadota bacterium]